MPKTSEPRILFEDANVIVVSKPAGMLSQSDISGDASLVDWLRKHVKRNYVGLVHRLDRNTSGLLIVAKRTKAAQRLTADLQAGRLERLYLAWVKGRVEAPVRWVHRLHKDERTNTVTVVSPAQLLGKEAVLSAKPVAAGMWKGAPVTLMEYRLETGRSHQIRVQSAHEGFAILGDVKYGTGSRDGFARPALHSFKVRFAHPISGEILEFTEEPPPDMQQIKSG